jgi:hypothetical protein
MSTIKWGQRCIARRFETVQGTVVWKLDNEIVIGKEGVVTRLYNDGTVLIDFEGDGNGECFLWLTSALEPIPETPNVWWPKQGDKVLHNGKIRTVTGYFQNTHMLDNTVHAHFEELSPVPTTEITPEEAVRLLEQHTGKSFTIKSK